MKKLMFAAATVAVAGGAFANPLVYDYKASVKQINLKEKKVKYNGIEYNAYIKYQSTASLKGYLIQDADGATSPSIQALVGSGNSVPATRPSDWGYNTAFLVVQNSKADKKVRFPKIIPSLLDAKWIDAAIEGKTGIAEGYLYSGGDIVAGGQREALDLYKDVLTVRSTTAQPQKGFIGDYAWTSVYLFGKYNGPMFFTGLWDNAEGAIDAVEPIPQGFTAGTSYFYHDTWMNGAGIGKWSADKENVCCGGGGALGPMYTKKIGVRVLDSLAGNLKGGIFLCTENGTELDGAYVLIGNYVWEDQFLVRRWDKTGANPGTWVGAGDFDQTDLWHDGELELNTRDVVSGTWSIKRTSKLVAVSVTNAELDDLTAAGHSEDAKGLKKLLDTIKGAAVKLNSDVKFVSGDEIWNEVTPYHDQVTFLTPAFCAYYGLLNFK
jgi:hypothetical protein